MYQQQILVTKLTLAKSERKHVRTDGVPKGAPAPMWYVVLDLHGGPAVIMMR